MADFGDIVCWCLKLEDSTLSGAVNNLMDGQGKTRYGIAEFSHPNLPANFYTCDPATALQMATEVYRSEYWNRIKGDQLLDNGVASCLMSFGINDGTGREIMLLQHILGFSKTDGVMGPLTLEATNKTNPTQLAPNLRTAQANFYRMLVAKQPTDQRFLSGWLKRASLIYPCLE